MIFDKKIAVIVMIILLFAVGLSVMTLKRSTVSKSRASTSAFVTRTGSNLFLNGKPFRFAGANIYWLGLDENVGGIDYPTHQRIDDVFTAASAMGTTVVRSHTLGITAGCHKCLEPSLNQFNDQIFDSIDYAIKVAGQHNIKLIIPLIDQWYFYNGGKHNFTDWRGLSNPNVTNDPGTNAFHHDPTVIQDFKNAINHLLTHVNQYTGLALKDDPTIIGWETGNELFTWTTSTQSGSDAWSDQWTNDIATYIKSLAPSQLVADGRISNESHPFTEAQYSQSLTNPAVDMLSIHQYPMTLSTLLPSIKAVVAANKVVYVGEYDWINHNGGDSLPSYLSAIENSSASGDIYWDLFPQYVNHNDGYTLHYPGDSPDMQNRVQQLSADAAIMSGLQSLPPTPTAEVIPTPTFIPSGTNLLQNSSFESSTGTGQNLLTPWWLEIKTGGAATIAQDSSTKVDSNVSAKVNITQTDAFWKVQLYQHTAIQSNKTYFISFWAKAATPEQVTFVLQQSASPNTIYFQQVVNITTSWQQYVLTYPAVVTDADVLFNFNIASTLDTLWFDNVSFTTNSSTISPTITPTVPPSSPTPTLPVSSTKLGVIIKLHGIGIGGDNANPNGGGTTTPLHQTRNLSLTLFNATNQLTGTVSGSIVYQSSGQQNGEFTGSIPVPGSIPAGSYTAKASSLGYLTQVVPGIFTITTGQQTNLQTTALTTGDINGDNKIDKADYDVLVKCFNDFSAPDPAVCSASQLSASNLDDNSVSGQPVVDASDLTLWLREVTTQNGG